MGEKSHTQFPYKKLGAQIKRMREKSQESIAEVSGAVEIDTANLTDIERGVTRPSEDILMLLMNHFAVKEEDAVKLWELAGYSRAEADDSNETFGSATQQVFVLPMDARIIYSDMAHVSANKHGVSITFMQSVGLNGQPLAVSRIGMSREQTEHLLYMLQTSLASLDPKQLPPSAPDANKETKEEK